MDNVKPWQIVLFVVAVAVLIFSVWKFGFSNSIQSQLANEMMLVDVQTGQLYVRDLSGNKSFIIPSRNPETDEISLLPVLEVDGEWILNERYLNSLEQVTVPKDAITDPKKPVKVSDANPVRLK